MHIGAARKNPKRKRTHRQTSFSRYYFSDCIMSCI
uniref:Uncharacterized protein n=1 Tax=Arundo donax TaxID=35708 RepID=A0A0A9HM67_ARUDO